jgi:NADH-quinone oxidoreductase subunit M
VILPYPLLWATLIAPLIASLAARGRTASEARPAAYVLAAALAAPAVIVGYYLARGAVGEGVVDPLILDLTRQGIGVVALAVDGLSAPVVVGVSIVTALVAVYSLKYMEVRIREMEEHGERPPGLGTYYFLYALFSVSMLGMAYSVNFILFFIFLELSLISSFLLILYYGYGDRRRIALLYFVWTHIAGAAMLAGALAYGVSAGSFDAAVPEAGRLVYVSRAEALGDLAALAGALVVIGLLVKMAVIGVHMWLPYAHAEAPTPVSALLSPNLVGLGAYGLARFALSFFPGFIEDAAPILLGLAVATIVYGGFVALQQNDFKRLLAYSSVSQMGYLLLGIATLTAYGVAGSMLFYLSHAVGKAILFMVAGVLIAELGGLRAIPLMGGLARLYPATAAAALIGFLHLSGIPPSFGFWGELMIVLGAAVSPGVSSPAKLASVALALIAAFTVTAAYSFITMRRIFFGPPRRSEPREEIDEFKATVVTLAILGLALFLVAGPFFSAAQASVEAMLAAYLG